GIFFAEKIALSLAGDADIVAQTADYLKICMVFCIGIFVETLAQRMLTAVGLTHLSMISLLFGAPVNIVLDPILIFGLLGFPALGIKGAAIATVIGQWAGAITALLLNRLKNPSIHFIRKDYCFSLSDVIDIYRIGMPTMIMQAVGSFMVGAVNAVLIAYSNTAVAFFGVYYKLQNFVMLPMNGLGQAALPIAAFNYGSNNKDRIRELYKTLVPLTLIMSLVGMAIFELLPSQLLSLFNASREMLRIGVPALRIIAVTFPLAAYIIVNGYFCTGLGNSVINMISAAIRQLIVLVPCLAILVRSFGLDKAWYAFWIAEICSFIYSYLRGKKEMDTKLAEQL
ncbi:MAG: MATE family efflux transporter, partial [Erysipelotrichaceae bacterium]|nr:MATE family efflux transporter [Erysipelotrichaceae bacterium]